MAHRVAPEAERDLGEIWDYIARESGSMEIADRLIDSLTDRMPAPGARAGIHRLKPLTASQRALQPICGLRRI